MARIFVDGPGITPGAENCKCGPDCECPCWQMLGLTDDPVCGVCGCSPAPATEGSRDDG